MKNDEDFFTTYDLNVSAVLVALGHSLDHVERHQGGRALFYFRNSPEVTRIAQTYWRQETTINPQKLFDSLKFLKSRLYSNF